MYSGLIVPPKEKKRDKKSRLISKLARSKNDHVMSQSQPAPGLLGLLETMRVQMEVSYYLLHCLIFRLQVDTHVVFK